MTSSPTIVAVGVRRGDEMVIPDDDVVYLDLTYESGRKVSLELSENVARDMANKLAGGQS